MSGSLSYTWKVFMNCLKDRQALALTFIAPSVIMLVIGYVIITMGSASTINVGIINTDQGMGNITASSAVINVLHSQNNINLVMMGPDDLDARMKNKTIDGALIFGNTFTSDLLTKKAASVRLVIEGTDQSKGLTLATMVSGISSAVAGQILKSPAAMPVTINSERYYGDSLAVVDFIAPVFMALITFVLACLFGIFTTPSMEKRAKSGDLPAPGPIGKSIAYVSGFSLFAFAQALTVLLYAKYYINAGMVGDIYSTALMLLLLSIVGVSVGVLISSVARSDVQRMGALAAAVILQILFGNLIVPIYKFPDFIQAFSYILPLTYVNDALQNIMVRGFGLGDVWADWTALAIIALAAMALSAFGFMRGPDGGTIAGEKRQKAA